LQQLGQAANRRQRRPEIVCHCGEERLARPFQLLQRGQVGEGRHRRGHHPVRVAHRGDVNAEADDLPVPAPIEQLLLQERLAVHHRAHQRVLLGAVGAAVRVDHAVLGVAIHAVHRDQRVSQQRLGAGVEVADTPSGHRRDDHANRELFQHRGEERPLGLRRHRRRLGRPPRPHLLGHLVAGRQDAVDRARRVAGRLVDEGDVGFFQRPGLAPRERDRHLGADERRAGRVDLVEQLEEALPRHLGHRLPHRLTDRVAPADEPTVLPVGAAEGVLRPRQDRQEDRGILQQAGEAVGVARGVGVSFVTHVAVPSPVGPVASTPQQQKRSVG